MEGKYGKMLVVLIGTMFFCLGFGTPNTGAGEQEQGKSAPKVFSTKAVLDDEKTSDNTEGNLVNVRLMVSNQSFEVDPVDIEITLDDSKIIDEKFKTGTGHSYKYFWVKLAEGKHKISIATENGGAVLKKEFEVTRKQRWISIAYWYSSGKTIEGQMSCAASPKKFDFNITGSIQKSE